MTIRFDVPPRRGDLPCLAAWAAVTVPERLSARRRPIRWLALALIPGCFALPLLGPVGVALAATLLGLAVAVRALALWHLLTEPTPARPRPPVLLPRVSVLLPLKGEEKVARQLVAAVRRLDYPSHLVEVLVLIEEADVATRAAIAPCVPPGWRVVAIPPGAPQTKARACNVGLALATGDVVVIFDAEDRPEPDQARKAVAALAADPRLAVVQARLGCDHGGWLPRFWAHEYDVLFAAIQPALARVGLPFLLGGTSNWFRAEALHAVGGWDAHNVTEDADLGVRLARAGWRSGVIDSTTWEEAPKTVGKWTGQRSRWLKGFAITTATHLSRPLAFVRDLGPLRAVAILGQLPVTVLCAALHPVGLALLLSGRGSGRLLAFGLVGYAVALALHLVVAGQRGTSRLVAVLMPVYWLLQSGALVLAFCDLFGDPTHWRKTAHGLAVRPDPAPEAPRLPTRHARPVALPAPGRPRLLARLRRRS